MFEILHSEAGLFRAEACSVERILRQSILEVLDVAAQDGVDELDAQESTREFFTMLEPHGIVARISGTYARSPFRHDPRKVQQIIRNLLSNALKHRRERVEVKISGQTDLLISVVDDGPGIADEDHDAVFQPFVRLGTGDGSVPGFGLGLTGARALVEAMGGTIALTSQQGTGTEFSVRIPPLE
jgi:signal transduction histidine kinase